MRANTTHAPLVHTTRGRATPVLDHDSANVTDHPGLAPDCRDRQEVITILGDTFSVFFAVDRQWRFIFVNRQAEKLFQVRRSQLLLKNIWEQFPDLLDTAFYEHLQRAARTTLPTLFEIFYQPACCRLKVHVSPSEGELSVFLTSASKQGEASPLEAITVTSPPSSPGIPDVIGTRRWLHCEFVERRQAGGAAHRYRQAVTAAAEAALTLNSSRNLDHVLDYVLEQAVRIAPCDAVTLMLVEDDCARAVRHRGYAPFQTPRSSGSTLTLPLTHPFLQRMIRTGRALRIPDTTKDPLWPSFPAVEEIRSYTGAPLLIEDRILGFLNLESKTPDSFYEETTCQLQAFASHAASAIDNARLHKNLEEALKQKQVIRAQLIQADKLASMGRLVASLAHEINNPLQAVRGCLALARELLAEQALGTGPTRYVSVAESEIDRIATIVMRMRDFYLPNRHTVGSADLHRVINEVVDLLTSHLQNHNIGLYLDRVEPGITLPCNPDHLKQIFLNLLLNAVDAMMETGGTVTIRVSDWSAGRENEARSSVKIEVIDTGVGIPPKNLERIFDPFFTDKKHGSGLGLSISREFVQMYGGTIAAQSTPGTGTTFVLLLPATADCKKGGKIS